MFVHSSYRLDKVLRALEEMTFLQFCVKFNYQTIIWLITVKNIDEIYYSDSQTMKLFAKLRFREEIYPEKDPKPNR